MPGFLALSTLSAVNRFAAIVRNPVHNCFAVYSERVRTCPDSEGLIIGPGIGLSMNYFERARTAAQMPIGRGEFLRDVARAGHIGANGIEILGEALPQCEQRKPLGVELIAELQELLNAGFHWAIIPVFRGKTGLRPRASWLT